MPTFPDRVLLPDLGLSIGHVTDPGVVRAENQDSLFVPDADTMDTAGRGVLVAVADGMGGHAGGALASRTACEALATFYTEAATGLPADLLALSRVERAHHRIQSLVAERPQLKGMGTTMTVALIVARAATIYQVGDSRAYLWRKGELKQLTTDHTLAQKWASRGTLRSNPGHAGKSVLTRAVGVGQSEVDRYDLTLEPGDRLLLNSDGLHGVVKDPALKETLGTAAHAWEAAKKLVQQAKDGGGPDNVTAVVLFVS